MKPRCLGCELVVAEASLQQLNIAEFPEVKGRFNLNLLFPLNRRKAEFFDTSCYLVSLVAHRYHVYRKQPYIVKLKINSRVFRRFSA